MRKLVALLALTSLIFAGSTFYYARELAREREGKDAAQVASDVRQPVLDAAVPVKAEASSATPGFRPGSGASPAAVTSKSATDKPKLSEEDLLFLEWAADPARRRKLVDEWKMRLTSLDRGLDRALGLNAAEYERLLELLAEQQVHSREVMVQCARSPDCDPARLPDLHAEQALDLSALLGPERKQRLDEFLETGIERLSVTLMRVRLQDADRLSDSQGDALVRVLADERKRAASDMAASPNGPTMSFDGIPLVVSGNEDYDNVMEQARAYLGRLRRRAAEVLTPGQLTVYDQIAAERLYRVGRMVESALPALKPGS